MPGFISAVAYFSLSNIRTLVLKLLRGTRREIARKPRIPRRPLVSSRSLCNPLQTRRSGILFVFSRITLRDVDRSQNALRQVLSRDVRDFHLRQVTNFNKTLEGRISMFKK